jgi:hypothetical protein
LPHGEDSVVHTSSVTIWTHVPRQPKVVGFAVGLSRKKARTIDILCDDAGLPRKAR